MPGTGVGGRCVLPARQAVVARLLLRATSDSRRPDAAGYRLCLSAKQF
jgi:hypothetical protein